MATLKLTKTEQQALDQIEKTWAEHLPELRVPTDSWLRGLLRTSGLEMAECAIERTGRKAFAERRDGDPMTAERGRLYCQSVAKNAATGNFPDRGKRGAEQCRQTQ